MLVLGFNDFCFRFLGYVLGHIPWVVLIFIGVQPFWGSDILLSWFLCFGVRFRDYFGLFLSGDSWVTFMLGFSRIL